ADEAQDKYGRKVSWGVEIGAVGTDQYERILFTHIAVPVMTRLRQKERQVLDTLVDAGVARSRSDALAWSVKLVGEHSEEWLTKLRDAMRNVDDLRSEGPRVELPSSPRSAGAATIENRVCNTRIRSVDAGSSRLMSRKSD